ncbi:MGMT family protein [bacterium]|nr:MGMT family protein [bacterium]
MKKKSSSDSVYQQLYDIVRQIPPGKVATYGQIAGYVPRCTARMAGYAMAAVPFGSDVPWQRVINSRGEISPRAGGDGADIQRQLLEAEGVVFNANGRVNFAAVRWQGLTHDFYNPIPLTSD